MLIKGYITLFAAFIAATIILYLPISSILKKKGVGIIRQSSCLFLFFSLFLVVFATIILFNLPISFNPERRILNLQPLQWVWEENIKQRIVEEIRPNIMIFIPLGFFIPIVFLRMRKFYTTVLAIFAVTFCIEFFQYFIGRSCDIDDLIANLLGGTVGYGIYKVLSCFFKRNSWWNKFIGGQPSISTEIH